MRLNVGQIEDIKIQVVFQPKLLRLRRIKRIPPYSKWQSLKGKPQPPDPNKEDNKYKRHGINPASKPERLGLDKRPALGG